MINIIKHSNFFAEFDIKNIPLSIVNGIRRMIYSDVESYCFSNINIIENTSVLHEQYLEHRISLIPLLNKEYIKENITFELKHENKTNDNKIIYSHDIKSIDNSSNIIPKNIPIIVLKPNEKIEILLGLEKSNGKKHARFIPVSNAVFMNKVNIDIKNKKINKEKADYIVKSCPKNIIYYDEHKENINVKNEDECIQCKSCMKTSEIVEMEDLIQISKKTYRNEPEFTMTIESKGQLTVKQILLESIHKLIELFELSIDLYIDDQNNYMLPELKHTYCNILSEYLRKDDDVIYSGYKVPHPLHNYSILMIRCKEQISQTNMIKKTIKKIIKKLTNIKQHIHKIF